MIKKLAIMTTLLPSLVFASPTCDLIKAKADLSASLVSSPYLVGSASNAPNDNSVSASIGYSFSGRAKAKLIQEIADVECQYSAAVDILQDYQKWVIPTIDKAAAKAELVELVKARELLSRSKDLAAKQLASSVITITEYHSIRQSYNEVVNRMLDLKGILGTPTDPIAVSALLNIVEKVKATEAKIQALRAELEDQSSWDISVTTGLAKEFGTSTSDPGRVVPQVGLVFKWSFGGGDTKVSRVRETAKVSVEKDRHSTANNQVRLFNLIETDIGVLKEKLIGLEELIVENDKVLTNLKSVDSAQSVKTRINLEIQTVLYKAEAAGLVVKLAEIDKYVHTAK